METKHLKKYAPEARRDFIAAVKNKAAVYGLLPDGKILPMKEEGDVVIIGDRPFPRSVAKQRNELEARIRKEGFQQFIEAVAYTWFNRFVAIRYMELHGYLSHGYRVLSHPTGGNQPEVMEYAERLDLPGLDADKVIDLKLDGRKDDELFRMLLVAQCNELHDIMPFMFEKVSDASELLLPDNLLHTESLVRRLVDGLPPEILEDIEAVGWLYQFYISEKKDNVFAALKKGKKITPQNIPAATQLFTPHWIVRYLVENSLGRLWMLNHPESKLVEKMDYYIQPEEARGGLGDVDSGQYVVATDELSDEPPCWQADWREHIEITSGKWRETMWLRPNHSLIGDYDNALWYALTIDGNAYAKKRWPKGEIPEEQLNTWQRGQFGDTSFEDLRCHLYNLQRSIRWHDTEPGDELHEAFWICYRAVCHAWDREWQDHRHELARTPNLESSTTVNTTSDSTQASEDFLQISSPEEIKICDPACGSGHMLTYAFDLLYAIYEEQGYQATDIPRLILTHNLYGIEIDQRAGALAAFALTMKAREKYRRFLTGGKVVQPNICVLENISIGKDEYDHYVHGNDETSALWDLCRRVTPVVFEEATENTPYLPTLTQIFQRCDYTKQAIQLANTRLAQRCYFTSKTRKVLRRKKILRKKLFLALRSGKPLAECSDAALTSHFKQEFKGAALAGEVLQYQDQIELTELIADFYFQLFNQFQEADNFGSLIRPLVTDVSEVLELLRERQMGEDLFLAGVHHKVLKALRQADYLSPKYHVVVANPPYMGRRNGMNDELKGYIQEHKPHCKADLYAAFLQTSLDLSVARGFAALVTMQSWMFLSSYKGIREEIVRNYRIVAIAHLGPRAFDEISGEVVQVACNVLLKMTPSPKFKPVFLRLVEGDSNEKRNLLLSGSNRFDHVQQSDFQQIEDCPLTYWLPPKMLQLFSEVDSLKDHSDNRQGLATGDDESFIRLWHEVQKDKTNWCASGFPNDTLKWYPFLKGGSFRKWYGNNEHCILFDRVSCDALAQQGNCLPSRDFYLRKSLVWSDITSRAFGARFNDAGKVFATGALSAFPNDEDRTQYILGYLNSIVHNEVMAALSSGIHYSVGYVDKSPLIFDEHSVDSITASVESAIDISRWDWDIREVSWDFTKHLLVHEQSRLSSATSSLFVQFREKSTALREIETSLNRRFLTIYGLSDSYAPEVASSEISLDCNPVYRYGSDKSDSELEALLLADTMREFISYAVGCMLGRYSLDKPGLILANQGETADDYRRVVGEYLVMSNEKEGKDGSEQLSGSDRVAESHGRRGDDLSGNEAVSEGGDLRTAGSDSQGSSVNSLKHSRRSGAEIDGRLQEVSSDRSGIESGSGNSTSDSSASELRHTGATETNSGSAGRDLKDEQLTSQQTRLSNESRVTSNEQNTQYSQLNTQYSFLPDEDNVIPLLDGDWFTDDISERFKEFFKVTFGTEHYEENLTFLENALYPDSLNARTRKTVRDYFLQDFFKHHLKLYKKRPIYWLFSSGKQKAFQAVIYMHRYNPGTLSRMRTEYVVKLQGKYNARIEQLEGEIPAASSTSRRKALESERTKLLKQREELQTFDEKLRHYADQRIELDLDDGVKVNYGKFGDLLAEVKAITGEKPNVEVNT